MKGKSLFRNCTQLTPLGVSHFPKSRNFPPRSDTPNGVNWVRGQEFGRWLNAYPQTRSGFRQSSLVTPEFLDVTERAGPYMEPSCSDPELKSDRGGDDGGEEGKKESISSAFRNWVDASAIFDLRARSCFVYVSLLIAPISRRPRRSSCRFSRCASSF